MTATDRESLTESQWLKATGEHHTQAIESWPDGFRCHHKELQVEPESGLGTQQNKIHWNSWLLWARLSFCLQQHFLLGVQGQLSKCPGWGWQAPPLLCPLGYVLSLHKTWSPTLPISDYESRTGWCVSQEQRVKLTANRSSLAPWSKSNSEPSRPPWAALCLFQAVAPWHYYCLSLVLACRDLICLYLSCSLLYPRCWEQFQAA